MNIALPPVLRPLPALVLTAMLASSASARPADPGLPDDSVYQLSSTWERHDGSTLKLETLTGQLVVIAMVYSTCQHTCPRIIADVRRLRSKLGDDAGRVRYVLVSLDPRRDTVERLAAFAKENKLDADGFLLLRGTPDDVRELAAVLDVSYRPISSGPKGQSDLAHSNLITILDERGVILDQVQGTGESLEAPAAALRRRLVESR